MNKRILIYIKESDPENCLALVDILIKMDDVESIAVVCDEGYFHVIESLFLHASKVSILKKRYPDHTIRLPFSRTSYNVSVILSAIKTDGITHLLLPDQYEPVELLLMMICTPKRVKKILYLHNLDKFVLLASLRQENQLLVSKKLSTLLNSVSTRLATRLCVLSSTVLSTARVYFPQEKLCQVPFRVASELNIAKRSSFESTPGERVKFVIPGAVDGSRRDYYPLIDALSGLDPEDYQLIFLGRVMDTAVREYAEKKIGESAVFFNDYIDESAFSEALLTSHFTIDCVLKNGKYGISKISGFEYDPIVFGLPVIISRDSYLFPLFASKLAYPQDNVMAGIKTAIHTVRSGGYGDLLYLAVEQQRRSAASRYIGVWAATLS